MALIEVLYGHRCLTPLNWIEPQEKVMFGPNLIDGTVAIVRRIQDNQEAVKSLKRVMQTRGIDPWSSKLEIMCI
jgi:hypothetical protein